MANVGKKNSKKGGIKCLPGPRLDFIGPHCRSFTFTFNWYSVEKCLHDSPRAPGNRNKRGMKRDGTQVGHNGFKALQKRRMRGSPGLKHRGKLCSCMSSTIKMIRKVGNGSPQSTCCDMPAASCQDTALAQVKHELTFIGWLRRRS